MKRYYIVYDGRVQGVGFRWQILNLANQYHLTGYVRNLANGKVETEVQGEKVDEFLKATLNIRSFARIDDYSLREMGLVEGESGFNVRR